MVELAVVGFLCIHLDFLVEVVVLVEGCWWVWIFDSFGFFGGGGGCGCVEGYWWWRLWLWVSGFAGGGGGGAEFCDQTIVLDFLSDSGVWVMSYGF